MAHGRQCRPLERISEKFLEATERDALDRKVWLGELKAEDPDLWREVAWLLAAHVWPHAVLDNVAADYLSPVPLAPAEERWIGRRIGAYVLVDLLGRGGMGEVYRARRADTQYEKEVAIKAVRSGYDTKYVLDRFRAERQILADPGHPNIARLLDGGATEEGLPYLVMELMEGDPIDTYCDRQQGGGPSDDRRCAAETSRLRRRPRCVRSGACVGQCAGVGGAGRCGCVVRNGRGAGGLGGTC